MAEKKPLKKMSHRKVEIFKMANRKGYAAIADKHLTEGSTPLQAYDRMVKACKRSGFELPALKSSQIKIKK